MDEAAGCQRAAVASEAAAAASGASPLRKAGLYAYRECFETPSPDQRDSIADEMTQVFEAPSDRAAGKVIEWWRGWGHWQPYRSATAAARDLRRVMREFMERER